MSPAAAGRLRLAAPVVLGSTVGAALSWLLFVLMIDREESQILREHQRTAQAQIAAITAEVEASLHTLRALQGLIQFNSGLDARAFRAFYEVMLLQARNRGGVRLVEWMRQVPARKLGAYEKTMRARLGDPGFLVWQPDGRGGRRRATGRPWFHVVEMIEPREEHGHVRGLDSGHSEPTQQALWLARRRMSLAATAGFKLAQDPPGRVSVVVYAPVCPGPRTTLGGISCDEPAGLAAVGISGQALLDAARITGARPEFTVEVFDKGIRGDEEVLLAARRGTLDPRGAWKTVNAPPVAAEIQVANRSWRVVCSGAYPLPWSRTWPAWLLLATCILITAAVQALIVSLQRQNVRVRQEVLKRTRQLRQAIRLARAGSEAKSQFLAKISHEIRTPLNGIIGMTHLLMDSGLNAEQRDSVQVILSASRHLLAVVNDTLDLSKIEAGKLLLQNEPFEPVALLRECERIYQPAAEQKGLRLTVTAGEGLPDWVIGDVTRLRQVIWNLLSNAIKFTEQGSVALYVRPGSAAPRLRFEVRDTGPGIGAEDQKRLFEPYFQSSRPGRSVEGTGLGLAISRRLVEIMGGEMGCESRPGEGSLFWFELPLPECEAPAGQNDPQAPSGGDLVRLSVLVAEDNPVNQKVLRKLLKRLGCRVTVAADGAEAVQAAGCGGFDVIFMDCQMPQMDGYEAARRIRQMGGPLERVPIVALTAHAMDSDRKRCLEAGMSDYLTKPVSLDALRAALERVASAVGREEG
ncbi:MAG: response regulator [Bryobacteraceae bacterium]